MNGTGQDRESLTILRIFLFLLMLIVNN